MYIKKYKKAVKTNSFSESKIPELLWRFKKRLRKNNFSSIKNKMPSIKFRKCSIKYKKRSIRFTKRLRKNNFCFFRFKIGSIKLRMGYSSFLNASVTK